MKQKHLEELYASGISDEIIQSVGVRDVAPIEAAERLGWEKCQSGGILYPYYKLDGTEDGVRIKLDKPLPKRKYETPKGAKQRLYIPPPAWKLINSGTNPMYFVEGEKKLLSLLSRGLPAVGLPGLYAPTASKGDVGPLDAVLDNIPMAGRQAVILFDSDIHTNQQVEKAAEKLAAQLIQMEADVLVARLPPKADGSKQGIDDFLVAAGADAGTALAEIVEQAKLEKALAEVDARTGGQEKQKTPPAAELADAFLMSHRHSDGEITLRRHKNEFFRWENGHYTGVSDEDLETLIFRFMETRLPPAQQTPRLCKTIAQCVQYKTALDSVREAPFWINSDDLGPNRDYIALDNGIFSLQKAFNGDADCLMPLTPAWFSPVSLDFSFDPNADCPRWLEFLQEVLPGDPELIRLLQMWFGYCLVPDTSLHKALMLVGDGSNGKSVILAVLIGLLGQGNVSAVPLEAFGTRFGLMPTIGKLANVVFEIGELDRVAEGAFKSFTAGDLQTIDRKNKDPLETPPTARLVLATNRLPRFVDRTDGVWRRLIIVPFNVQIPEGRQDELLLGKLKAELPGILNWALIGLYMLRQQRRFPQVKACSVALQAYRLDSNPTMQFLQEFVAYDPTKTVHCTKLFQCYRS
jgi:putative DNA primase/helicase